MAELTISVVRVAWIFKKRLEDRGGSGAKNQIGLPLVLHHANVQKDEVVRSKDSLKPFVLGHSDPSSVDLFRAEFEVFLAEGERLGVGVVVKHSRDDVAANGVLQIVNLKVQAVVKRERESSEHERKVDPIFMANETARTQLNPE
ncbi:unnamed protein product [Fusarium venenatum]|uniref:Uncharacterized protein n=1 Tax=Fusarium venenatum TaxID=56646 RepID=A0A2L2SZT8_9HYPO|nr:uncharacterized protein FVRRES_07124 [Fusarium venenatum]CEI62688.1 unnamed protein product [Fusarium venenatum]